MRHVLRFPARHPTHPPRLFIIHNLFIIHSLFIIHNLLTMHNPLFSIHNPLFSIHNLFITHNLLPILHNPSSTPYQPPPHNPQSTLYTPPSSNKRLLSMMLIRKRNMTSTTKNNANHVLYSPARNSFPLEHCFGSIALNTYLFFGVCLLLLFASSFLQATLNKHIYTIRY